MVFEMDNGTSTSILAAYRPVQHFGNAGGVFVGLVRVMDDEAGSSLSLIVGPSGGICAEEIVTLADTAAGAALAETIGASVLRALDLSTSWRPGTSWQQETV